MKYRVKLSYTRKNGYWQNVWRLQTKGWIFWHETGIIWHRDDIDAAEEYVKRLNESPAT